MEERLLIGREDLPRVKYTRDGLASWYVVYGIWYARRHLNKNRKRWSPHSRYGSLHFLVN